MTNDERAVLAETRRLLTQGWTQKVFAQDYDGNECSPHHQHAAQFCLLGAAIRAEAELETYLPGQRHDLARLLGFIDGGEISLWNDAPTRTQAEVLARIDKALA